MKQNTEFDVIITDPATGEQRDLNPDGTFSTLDRARSFIEEKLRGIKLRQIGNSRKQAIDFYDEKRVRRAIILRYEEPAEA